MDKKTIVLIKDLLLFKEKSITDRKVHIVKNGNNVYILRTLYIIAKDSFFIDNHKKIEFYLKIKNEDKKPVLYPKAKISDLIIDDYAQLIRLIKKIISNIDNMKYKIFIYSSNLILIETTDQLLSYKGTVIYAKIKQFTNKDNSIVIRKNHSYDKNKSDIYMPIIRYPYDKSLILFIKNIKLKNNNTKKIKLINKSKINDKFRNFNISKKTIRFSGTQTLNNFYKIIPIKKNKSLSEDNFLESSYTNSFSKVTGIIGNYLRKMQNKNEKNNISYYNIQDKSNFNENIFIESNLNKSKSALNILNRKTNNRLFRNNILNDIYAGNIRKKLFNDYIIQPMEKDFNENDIYNLSFSRSTINVEKNFNSSVNDQIKTKKNIINISKKINQSIMKDFELHKDKQNNINLISNFLKSPSKNFGNLKKSIRFDENHFGDISLIYYECLYELNYIINNANEFLPGDYVNIFLQQLDFSDRQQFNFLDIKFCLKQFLILTYFDKCLKMKYSLALRNILKKPLIEISIKDIENVICYFLVIMKETKKKKNINNNNNIIEYIQSFKNIHQIILVNDFFFTFILCSNVFNKLQREIGKKIILTLEIKEVIFFEKYVKYYIYFRYNHILKIDDKKDFLVKFLYIIQGVSEDHNRNTIQKLNDDIQYIFRIDNKTKEKLLGNLYESEMDSHLKIKIERIFNSLIKFFSFNYYDSEM